MEVKPKGLAEVVNVTLVRNGNHKDSRVALVKRSEGLNGALKIAKNKFKIKVLIFKSIHTSYSHCHSLEALKGHVKAFSRLSHPSTSPLQCPCLLPLFLSLYP